MMKCTLQCLMMFLMCMGLFDGKTVQAQQDASWDMLRQVSYATVLDPTEGYTYEKIIFGDAVKSLDGKEVILQGYILPMDNEGYQYVISAYPYAACFFCGQAGKESVVQLWLTDFKRKYNVDEYVTFRGIFELNDDQFGLCYLLREAELVNP